MLEILVPPGRIPLVGPELFTVWKSRGEDLHPSLGLVCCEGWSCYEQGISNPERGRLRLSQQKQLLLLCEVRAEERMCLLTVNSRGIDSRREKNCCWPMYLSVGPGLSHCINGLLKDVASPRRLWFSSSLGPQQLWYFYAWHLTYSQVEINLISVWEFQIWELSPWERLTYSG